MAGQVGFGFGGGSVSGPVPFSVGPFPLRFVFDLQFRLVAVLVRVSGPVPLGWIHFLLVAVSISVLGPFLSKVF